MLEHPPVHCATRAFLCLEKYVLEGFFFVKLTQKRSQSIYLAPKTPGDEHQLYAWHTYPHATLYDLSDAFSHELATK